jgi:hypothetical protein
MTWDVGLLQIKIEAVKQKIRHALLLTQMKPGKVAVQADLQEDMRQLGEKPPHLTSTNVYGKRRPVDHVYRHVLVEC